MKKKTGVTFYVRTGGYIHASYYAVDGRCRPSLGISCDPDKYPGGLTKDQRALLRRVESAIEQLEATLRTAGIPLTKDRAESKILEAAGKLQKKALTAPVLANGPTFSDIFNRYYEGVKDGTILNDGTKYSDSYIKIARVVLNNWLPGSCLDGLRMSALNEEVMRRFVASMVDGGLAKNSVASYMDIVSAALINTRRLGWHKAPLLDMGAFRTANEEVDHKVYVTPEQLQKIAKLPLEGKKAVWRDAFILGCWVGMRHSDFSRLKPENRQGNLLHICTTKTRVKVWAPMSPVAKEIWERHGGVFDLPHRTAFGIFIKSLGKDAGIDKQMLFARTEGGKKVERWCKAHELMSTHTMRRSFATNAYLEGVPMASIMKITAHKSTRSFLKYLCLTAEQHADQMLDHSFFK